MSEERERERESGREREREGEGERGGGMSYSHVSSTASISCVSERVDQPTADAKVTEFDIP